ncbi:hypothetical protein ACFQZC_10465 [Streptacidiphilus monticola]
MTVRRPDGRLVALAPLMRGPGGLRPIGVGLTDFHDVLIDPEHAEQAAPCWPGRWHGSCAPLGDAGPA